MLVMNRHEFLKSMSLQKSLKLAISIFINYYNF